MNFFLIFKARIFFFFVACVHERLQNSSSTFKALHTHTATNIILPKMLHVFDTRGKFCM